MQLRKFVLQTAKQRTAEWIDYFVFTRKIYEEALPPFVIGRVFWDNWLLWKVLSSRYPVVDVSPVVLAVHQNHDYGYHPQGKAGVFHGEESSRNCRLAGGWRHLRTMDDATEILHCNGLKKNLFRFWATMKRYVRQAGRILFYNFWHPIWFFLLDLTRPLRQILGLRSGAAAFPQQKFRQ